MSDEPTPGSILVALNELCRLSTGQLRDKYTEVFGEATTSRNRSYLLRKIAGEIQGHDDVGDRIPATTGTAGEVAPATVAAFVKPKPSERDPRLPPPGTVLERAHSGGLVRVTVLEDAFEYKGGRFRSLSAVARAATGTAWDGLLFFRLKPYAKRRARG